MSQVAPLPPPRREASSVPHSRTSTPEQTTWMQRWGTKGKGWGGKAFEKSIVISDKVGTKVNYIAENKIGSEAFWPVSNDFPQECEKAARILRVFTVKGIEVPDKHSHKKALRKIPPTIIKNCYGIAVFTSMRSGIAPLGGAGGNGLVVAHDPKTGWWSPPASISPNNVSAGLLLGVDIYDCVLVLNSQKAIDSFGTHKVTLGAELAVAAGPWGAGAAMESGKEGAPVFSYVKSRGLYAGVEAVGQAFLSRFDENERIYHWPGVKAKDILTGHVKMPREAKPFVEALEDAACGRAQTREGPPPEDPMFKLTPIASAIDLEDGEVLKLPPTPDMTDGHEHESDPETEKVIRRMTLPSDFAPPPEAKKWTPPLPPPRHGSAPLHHPTPRRAGPSGTPPPRLPPRRRQASNASSTAASSPLSGSPTIPSHHETEMPPTPITPGTEATTIPVMASKPPPLPPRSRNRPPSMAIPPTPISPTSPVGVPQVAAVPESHEVHVPSPLHDDAPASAPPSYDYEEAHEAFEKGVPEKDAEAQLEQPIPQAAEHHAVLQVEQDFADPAGEHFAEPEVERNFIQPQAQEHFYEPEAEDHFAEAQEHVASEHLASEHATTQALHDLHFDDAERGTVAPEPIDAPQQIAPEVQTTAFAEEPVDGGKHSKESSEQQQQAQQEVKKEEAKAASTSETKADDGKKELPKSFNFARREAGNLGFRE